jgi:tetraacyldisaccharide 4'-kinase
MRKRIESVMFGAEQRPLISPAPLLYLMSRIYGGLQKIRATCYRHQIIKSKHLPCKVISVGNITVGGTGKTPMTIYLAQRVQNFGYTVAVISRGYKGRLEKTGGIVSDGKQTILTPEQSGDEPYMFAAQLRDIPVIVGQNRFEAGMLAADRYRPDVVILDDAFQHMQLARDINLVLLDYDQPFGNFHLLPRGILREPISALGRADALILTRSQKTPDAIKSVVADRLKPLLSIRPLFTSRHIPYCCRIIRGQRRRCPVLGNLAGANDLSLLKGRRVFAFSGIARNHDFRSTIEKLGCEVSGFFQFADHHTYSEIDRSSIVNTAQNSKAEFLITTDKDYERLGCSGHWGLDLVVMGVKISFGDDANQFDDFIKQRLGSQ